MDSNYKNPLHLSWPPEARPRAPAGYTPDVCPQPWPVPQLPRLEVSTQFKEDRVHSSQPESWLSPAQCFAGGLCPCQSGTVGVLLAGALSLLYILLDFLRESTHVLLDTGKADPLGVEQAAVRAHTHQPAAHTAPRAEDQKPGLV